MTARKYRIYVWSLIFAVALANLLLTSCIFPTSSTTVKGCVTDGEKPVADAEVRFGGVGSQTTVKTKADGGFTITARHRPTQMLYLTISKPGFAEYSDKFPGFAAPSGNIEIELLHSLAPSR
jgi:hypothetical protein